MRLINPLSNASVAGYFRAVYTSSLTKLSDPTTFGNLCNVPTSAAMPMSTSFIWKYASEEAYRMSVVDIMSTPAPMHAPCTAAITGFGHCQLILHHYFACTKNM